MLVSDLAMQSAPSLVTSDYLRKRFAASVLAVVVGLVLCLAVGWYTLSRFDAHAKYAPFITDLMQVMNRFKSEVEWEPAEAEKANTQRSLKHSFYDVVELLSLFHQFEGQDRTAVSREWISIEKMLGVDVDVVLARYAITTKHVARDFAYLLDAENGNVDEITKASNEFVILASRLVKSTAPASAEYRANAGALKALMANKLWPTLYTALHVIGNGTADVSRLAVYLLLLSAAIGVAVSVLNGFLVFRPLEQAVLLSQEDLIHERNRALSSEQARQDFLAIVSHELRTPLNGVLGFSNLLLGTPLATKQKEYAETIHTSGQTLLSLLNDVADIAQIKSGTLELQKRDFSIEAVANEVISQLAPQTYTKRLDLAAFVDPNLPEKVSGDMGRVRQVLLKLVSNAIKFTERGGISIEVKRSGGREEGVHDIMFSVTDTGIGVPKNQAASVFDHFGYIDATASRQNAGTGIELPVCKKLVQLMGGEMGVESTLFKGSTFWFRIKLADTAPAAKKIKDSMGVNLTGRRVLVVEHDTLSRSIFRFQLESFNAEVDCVPDARTAINALIDSDRRKRAYDLAIIDHEAPEIDGIDLRKSIRECPEFRDLKLVISASEGIAFDQQARALGFDAACPKPVVQERLIRQVQDLLERPARSELAATPPSLAAIGEALSATPEAPAESEPQEVHQPHLLIAEDNIINQRLVVATLTQAGYAVDAVGDGVEALQAMQKTPYDLVLMDIRMPVMSGVDATRRIRALPSPAGKCPIIAMTANTLPGDREEYLAAGMNEYVPKPIDFPMLLEKIEMYLSGNAPDTAGSGDNGGKGDETSKRNRKR